jgi:hypothetical protein
MLTKIIGIKVKRSTYKKINFPFLNLMFVPICSLPHVVAIECIKLLHLEKECVTRIRVEVG